MKGNVMKKHTAGRVAYTDNKRKLVGILAKVAETNDTGLARPTTLKLVERGFLTPYVDYTGRPGRAPTKYKLTAKANQLLRLSASWPNDETRTLLSLIKFNRGEGHVELPALEMVELFKAGYLDRFAAINEETGRAVLKYKLSAATRDKIAALDGESEAAVA
jgi:hypothetical protein